MMAMALITVVATYFARETFRSDIGDADAETRPRTERFVRKPAEERRDRRGLMTPRDGLHPRGDPDQVRAGRVRRRGLGAPAPRRLEGDGGQRSRRHPRRDHRAGGGGDRGGGHRGRRLRPRPRRADGGVAAGGGRLRRRRRLRRLRRRRRRLEPRHREGRRPRRHPPGGDHGLRQPAGRRGPQAARAAAAAARDPDDGGHGVGGHHGRRSSTSPTRRPRAASRIATCARTRASSTPSCCAASPAEVTSSCGLDVVCHAVESFVSKPYDQRERPESPDDRPPYQGANPVSDVWSAKALEYGGRYLRRAVADADDLEARGAMMLAASLAGIGFGSAGVHIPHACAYPIASLKHAYQPPGYPDDHPFVPARLVGHRHGAGGVPLHLRGRPGEAPARGRADRGPRAARRRRAHAAARSSPS